MRTWIAAIAAVMFACGGSASTTSTSPVDPTGDEPAAAKPFENPGGMWMPRQLADHADLLKSLGLELDPKVLADPMSPPLAAIVSLGGCSASFVSPQGLIATNHHCVKGSLQYHSTPDANLVETGFLAKTRADEKNNGPTARVYVTQAFTEITEKVLGGVDQIPDDKRRHDAIEQRQKDIVAACEKDRPDVRCRVAGYFGGSEYYVIEMLMIRDVRLVYAPHGGIGWFGGDEDNWMWPRHTGDYSFYRAYVGKDGKPADFSPDNVPYEPKHHLKVATGDLKAGDLVMVAGYPGRTYRHRTAAQVSEAVDWRYPHAIARYEEYLKVLAAVSKTDKDAAIKAQSWDFWMNNALKNNRGMMDGLTKGGLADSKSKHEAKLREWIASDAKRKASYGGVLEQLEAITAEREKYRERDAALGEIGFSRVLSVASTIVRMAEERPKKDSERDPRFQERNWKRMIGGQKAFSRRYNRALDRALLGKALERAARNAGDNADWLEVVLGKGPYDEAKITKALARLYKLTKLEKDKVRIELLNKATTASLRKSRDPFIQLALALRPIEKKIEEREESTAGKLAVLKPRYMAALREFSGGAVAPDANGTLRVTYGTVRGYTPKAGADPYLPFTTVDQVVGKHRGETPFNVPEGLLAQAKSKKFGSYADDALGNLTVNFLSDLDSTGGNSGSATLNARGELVGLLFDGNYEAMASDWLFIPELTRAIHVDIRYVLWIMDAVDGADHLLEEMGVEPSIQ